MLPRRLEIALDVLYHVGIVLRRIPLIGGPICQQLGCQPSWQLAVKKGITGRPVCRYCETAL